MYELNKGLLIILVLMLVYTISCKCQDTMCNCQIDGMCNCRIDGMCCGRDKMYCGMPVPRQFEPFGCLPENSSMCAPGNSLEINNRTYWFKYSRLINGKKVWALSDRNGWPLTFPQARVEIPIGSTACLNGQSVGTIIGLYSHPNMPYSSFAMLDTDVELDLSGQNIKIIAPAGSDPQSSGVVM
jgi:hypothetical protein